MNGEALYKKLVNREDLKDVPLILLMKVAIAVLEEINKEDIYESI